ncbi:MAG: DNA-binding protein [Candidatus Bathyarchaeia archaeon]|nr:DNA-binding protein [Candidatus Bathyarchaeota archaeon]
MSEDEEVELIRRRKLAELQKSLIEEQRRAQIRQQMEARKQAVLKAILTPEARARLTNIRMVKPEVAESLEDQLIQLAQTGRLPAPITDRQLKEILRRIQSLKRDIRIRRI